MPSPKRAIFFIAVFAVLVALRNMPALLTVPYRAARLAFRPADNALAMPVAGVKVRQIAATWGAPRAPQRRHEGQDIFARRGTPVTSATEGVVLRTGVTKLGGRVVWVLGAGARAYYYAHLDRWAPDIVPGKEVSPGTLLGYVGNTGNARTTPPHLHFGVYGQGGAVNPLPLLARGEQPDHPRAAGVMARRARSVLTP